MKYYIGKIDGYELLKKILLEEYNIDNYEIIKNEYGKPYLKDYNIFFNISNSKGLTLLAISDKEIGIDIQYITYDEMIVKKYYNDKEQRLVYCSDNKEETFTKIWTIKEAYLKKIGTGIIDNLKNVDTTQIKAKSFKYESYYISIVS